MKTISISDQPARSGTDSRITQKMPSVARLEKNIPTELMMKSARYCMRALIYCASMMKYKRRYSPRVRILSSTPPQNFDCLIVEQARTNEQHDDPNQLHEQHGQENIPALIGSGNHHQRGVIYRLKGKPKQNSLQPIGKELQGD